MEIQVTKLLDTFGIDYVSAGVDNVKTLCWNPAHKDSNMSLFIHKKTGVFNCFGCGIKGNILTILNQKGGMSGADALLFLREFALDSSKSPEDKRAEVINSFRKRRSRVNTKITRTIIEVPKHKKIDSNNYLEKRGFTSKEMLDWKMGVCLDYPYKDWILIPIYFKGILRTYFLRSTKHNRKRYGSYPRRDILFGLDSCKDRNKPIYILEGIFDMIYMRRAGVQAVASLSNRLLPEQRENLKRFKKVVLVPDTDDRGTQLMESARELLFNCSVNVCKLPANRKDAAECTVEELINSINTEYTLEKYLSSIEYINWAVKEDKSLEHLRR